MFDVPVHIVEVPPSVLNNLGTEGEGVISMDDYFSKVRVDTLVVD